MESEATRTSTQDQDDVLIIERCSIGDPRGFAMLHEKYAPTLTNVLKKMLRKRHDAVEDVVQDVFVRFMEDPGRFRSFRGESKLSTWLIRIAINIATNLLKAEKRSKVDPNKYGEDHYCSDAAPAFVAAQDKELRERIVKALDAVPEKWRRFLKPLVEAGDSLSIAEIEELAGVTPEEKAKWPDIVRSRLYYGRREFGGALGSTF